MIRIRINKTHIILNTMQKQLNTTQIEWKVLFLQNKMTNPSKQIEKYNNNSILKFTTVTNSAIHFE